MKIGWHLPCSTVDVTPQRLIESASTAEDAGYDSLWVNEHILVPAAVDSPYPFSDDGAFAADPHSPYAEPLATLAFVAAVTSRAELGTSVLISSYRHPLLMAKTAATVDLLCDGRLILGLGAGWMREEFEALDVPFGARGKSFDEHLEILQRAFSEPTLSYDGDVFRFDEVGVEPRPARGQVPIWIGTGRTRVALRRAIRWASAVHMIPADPTTVDDITAMRAAIEAACEEEGRAEPPELTARARVRVGKYDGGYGVLAGSAEEVADALARHAEAGVTHFVFDCRDVGYERMQATIEPLATALQDVGIGTAR
jgi:probable F420-dependent oxidoreductase